MMMTTPPPGQALTAETDWRSDYARVESIREEAERHDRSARSSDDPMARSDHETQAAMAWERYGREVKKLNASDPASQSTAPTRGEGERTIRVGDDCVGPWRIWFDPPPIGTRNCDWHYQHEDDDGCAGLSGSCGSRDECLEEIILNYEERGS